MGVNVKEGWKEKMASRLYCKGEDLPFKYLGIPIGGSHRRIAMWRPLVESVKRKLALWKGRHLSFGGRITLINSVLSSLLVFLMSVYLLPKGVREMRKFNLALMGKWWGRLASKEQGLWDKVIANKYGGRGGHWLDWVREGRGIGSLWWRDVCCINNVDEENEGWLTERFKLKLGEGKGERRKNATKCAMRKMEHASGTLDGEEPYSTGKERKLQNYKERLMACGYIWTVPTHGREVEDSNHLFLKCKLTKWLWKACRKWWGIAVTLENDCWKSFEQFGEWAKESRVKGGWDCIWNIVVWSIWLARNQTIF
ncbi:hypothetical protein SLEP1_g29906 [Rubroshorea leprosula]|uniref:Reverse transcriptase zinc-binding domain-containing protein n=1 Tax=Rubroshorea leprosula TaxID=152421 RepID=A0AAV5K8T8_9ROSI|nr:hypothetical protein SLEP1_g29906 [Rubroshorea leprosula]